MNKKRGWCPPVVVGVALLLANWIAVEGAAVGYNCTLPPLSPLIDTSGCQGLIPVYRCNLNCITGYMMTDRSITCTQPNDTFNVSMSCQAAYCLLPRNVPSSINTTLCSTTINIRNVSQCILSCSSGYVPDPAFSSTPSAWNISCPADDYDFIINWPCVRACNKPSPIPSGYAIDASHGGCADGSAAASCKMKCDMGYSGTVLTTCATPRGTFNYTGCVENVCNMPSPPPDGVADFGCSGHTATYCNSAHVCSPNWYGTATATCPTNGSTFVFTTPCLPQCTLPTVSTGINTAGCQGTIGLSSCSLACATGYTMTSPLSVNCTYGGANFIVSGNCTGTCAKRK